MKVVRKRGQCGIVEYFRTKFRHFEVEKRFSLDGGSAEQPTKAEDTDLLEGTGEDLIEALVGVGAGARQLAGQVIGQTVVEKTDEPETEPGPATRMRVTTTRATKSLKDILAECR